MFFMTLSSEPKCRLLYYNLSLQGIVSCHTGESNLFEVKLFCRPKHYIEKYALKWSGKLYPCPLSTVSFKMVL